MTICHYLGYLAEKGTVKLSSNVYTSAINSMYTDLNLEPPATGPLVRSVRSGLMRMQTDLHPSPKEVPLTARAVEALAARMHALRESMLDDPESAAQDVRRLYLLRAMLFTVLLYCTMSRPVSIVCLPVDNLAVDLSADSVLVVHRVYTKTAQTMDTEVVGRLALAFPSTSPFHRELATTALYFSKIRRRVCPAARWFFQLPLDNFSSQVERNSSLAPAWFSMALSAISEKPPAGTVWVPRSCRSGACSAAEAIGVTRSKIQYWGGWVAGSTALDRHYIDPSMQPSVHCWRIFGFLSPRQAAPPL